MSDFVHLHVHTEYSMLDGAAKLKPLFAEVAALGMPAVAKPRMDRELFGPENYFLELMDHGLSIERRVRDGLLEIGRTLNLAPLATNDSHYVRQPDATAHEALLCVQSGKTLSDPDRFKFDGDGYYLKSADEMRALWDEQVPQACNTSYPRPQPASA